MCSSVASVLSSRASWRAAGGVVHLLKPAPGSSSRACAQRRRLTELQIQLRARVHDLAVGVMHKPHGLSPSTRGGRGWKHHACRDRSQQRPIHRQGYTQHCKPPERPVD